MKNVFLTFILLVVFLAPVGNAFAQAATVTFSNPNEALAYNELLKTCGHSREFAEYLSKQYKSGISQESLNKRFSKKANTAEDALFFIDLISMIFDENKTPSNIYVNCMRKGKALNPEDKRNISAILAGGGD